MTNHILSFAGRKITEEDIEHIKWARETYPNLSRTELAGTICHIIDWLTPSGRAKLAQCYDLLCLLEKEDIIDLPPKQKYTYKGKNNNNTQQQEPIHVDRTPVEGDIRELLPLTLDIVCTKGSHARWRYYMNQYHMLQAKTVFGSQLRYFIRSKGRDLGCMQFSASAWALKVRDRWIGWRKEDKDRLHLIVNNNRFLIFPWVRVQNLASKSLSLAAKQIQEDWKNEYGYAPVLLETFVDLHYFSGTCYQAANWIYLGLTRGTGRTAKQGMPLSKKAIYVYPLKKHFRAYLKGDLPYQVVDPDV